MRTKYLGIIAILAVACIVSAIPVSASLVATSFGFPGDRPEWNDDCI